MPNAQRPTPNATRVRWRIGRLIRLLEAREGCAEWEVEVEGGRARAVQYPSLTDPLAPGQEVWLNTSAVALGLGTGGAHFILAPCGPNAPEDAFPGREAGHILKLRYTPLQLRVQSVEEEGSPHRAAVDAFTGLDGTPVVAAELLSQAAAAALAARAVRPRLRIALVLLDTAALPAAVSRLAARLREEGVLAATVTTGQAFGGDYEAVNIYTGLIAARSVAGADMIVVSQGPGNVGTGTEYGFSGLALAEALHASDTLGGYGILAARMSEADPRPRHRPISHHTVTLLRCTRAPVTLPLPVSLDALDEEMQHFLAGRDCPFVDPAPAMPALEPYRDMLTTMGRTLEQDGLFFRAAAAAGLFAAYRVRSPVSGTGDAGRDENI